MIKLFEKFSSIEEVKEIIFLYAVDTYKTEIIDFFLSRGYDIDTDDALRKSTYDDNTFRHMIKKGADVEYLINDRQLYNAEVQKALIDNGHERFIHDNVGFNRSLKNDPKYADIVQRAEDVDKYNL